jgi:hypothetical protein
MKALLIAFTVAGLSGCTSWALQRTTTEHAESSADLRYQEVVENLAMIYANPEALPAYVTIYAGAADVTDTLRGTSQTTWARTAAKPAGFMTAFTTQSSDIFGSRAIRNTWTMDPVIVPERLRAMRAACRWALFGSENAGPDVMLLKTFQQPNYTTGTPGDPRGYYFGVDDKLANLPPHWLHCANRRFDVPRCACYWAGCRGKYVWVDSDGMEGLSQFLLVLQAIARVDLATTFYPPSWTRTVAWSLYIDPRNPNVPPPPSTPISALQKATVTLYFDQDGRVTPGDGQPAIPPKIRVDNLGQNSDLKAVINATAKSSS